MLCAVSVGVRNVAWNGPSKLRWDNPSFGLTQPFKSMMIVKKYTYELLKKCLHLFTIKFSSKSVHLSCLRPPNTRNLHQSSILYSIIKLASLKNIPAQCQQTHKTFATDIILWNTFLDLKWSNEDRNDVGYKN